MSVWVYLTLMRMSTYRAWWRTTSFWSDVFFPWCNCLKSPMFFSPARLSKTNKQWPLCVPTFLTTIIMITSIINTRGRKTCISNLQIFHFSFLFWNEHINHDLPPDCSNDENKLKKPIIFESMIFLISSWIFQQKQHIFFSKATGIAGLKTIFPAFEYYKGKPPCHFEMYSLNLLTLISSSIRIYRLM